MSFVVGFVAITSNTYGASRVAVMWMILYGFMLEMYSNR
ncbi:hypothetical protein SAMN05216564_103380 [Halopenitus persicus]|uniref:Uncharacterized protein n=1 Tax=Halopenitus persicus TaxID=1048396 RepID=A0A1H3HQ09_9EURY|nr:hypothetical protein SAMN05216564_103380 [Halopenitus persicus]